jgi:hypothetical protein
MTKDIAVDQSFIDAIKEMVEVTALSAGVNFEDPRINFDEACDLIISDITPMILGTLSSTTMSDNEKIIALISSMSYLALENFYLQVNDYPTDRLLQ